MKTIFLIFLLTLLPLSVGADNITICTDLVDCKYGKDENCNCIKQPKAESKSQEWREKCDKAIKNMSNGCGYQNIECQLATAYCTRALLEEMKK